MGFRSGVVPGRSATPLAAAVLLLAAALAGCAGGPGRPAPATVPLEPAPDAAWVLPASTFPTQRLFRLHYDSATEGDGALRLVLRLEDPERYRLTIADRLGRPLYTIDAGAGGGLLADHRERLVCPLEPDVRLEELPLDPLPLASLPGVLLGRVPAAPAGAVQEEVEAEPGGELRALSYADGEGRRWRVETVRGWPVAWSLWEDGEPRVWWRRSGDEARLADRERGLQMSWREVGREPLTDPLGPPVVPSGYEPGVCGRREGGAI